MKKALFLFVLILCSVPVYTAERWRVVPCQGILGTLEWRKPSMLRGLVTSDLESFLENPDYSGFEGFVRAEMVKNKDGEFAIRVWVKNVAAASKRPRTFQLFRKYRVLYKVGR